MYVVLNAPHAKQHKLKLLLDGGAEISLVKSTSLSQNTLVFNDHTMKLEGISKNTIVDTLGYVYLSIHMEDSSEAEIKFYVVDENTNIPYDGIIGNDLMRMQKAFIDYSKQTLKLKDVLDPVRFYFDDENTINSKSHNTQEFELTPRSETIIGIRVTNPKIREGVIPDDITLPLEGVYLSKAVVKVNDDGIAFATILNTRDTGVKVQEFSVRLDPLPECIPSYYNKGSNFDHPNLCPEDQLSNLKDPISILPISDSVDSWSNFECENTQGSNSKCQRAQNLNCECHRAQKSNFQVDDKYNTEHDPPYQGSNFGMQQSNSENRSSNFNDSIPIFPISNSAISQSNFECQSAQNSNFECQSAQNSNFKCQNAQNSNFKCQSAQNSNFKCQSAPNLKSKCQCAPKTCLVHNFKDSTAKSERLAHLNKELRLEHLNGEERQSIIDLCHKFEDIFFLEGDNLTCTNLIQHDINTGDAAPIFVKNYRHPHKLREEINSQVQKMLKQGIIQPSVSPWAAPLWIVPKKMDASGIQKWRVVVDYRKLNEVTIGDAYPLPRIEEILDQLGHSRYFTTLDLASGFHQIRVNPQDISKTAFCTPDGHYEYTRMPFGCRNGPATFQRLMNSVLTGLNGLQCFVYLDDVIIYAADIVEHSKRLQAVFQRLRDNKLLLQPDKCEFLRKEVAYLGHVISDKGIRPNPDKIKVIETYKAPKTEKELKAFLGLIGYYRRFIPDFAKMAKPLTKLFKKDQIFHWDSEQEQAFQKFKAILKSDSILQYPDFSQPFVLTTDASNFAIGAVLSQGPIGQDLPIAYASRTLNKAETNYSVTEKELLAIVWAVKHFRPYLYGRKFKIITDHRPLTWLFNVKDPGSRLVRWRLKLEEYEYEIVYKPGRINSNADALSRISVVTRDNEYREFIKYFQNTSNTTPITIPIIGDLVLTKPNAVLFTSADVDEENKLTKNSIDTFEFESLPKDMKLFDVVHRFTKGKNVFYCIHKNAIYDNISYPDLFYALKNLRELLIKLKINDVYVSLINNEYDRINPTKLQSILHFVFQNTDIKLTICQNTKKELTPDEIKTVLKENHNCAIAGHSGFNRTYARIRNKYYWPNMKTDIRKYIQECNSCQLNKTDRHPIKNPMVITTTSSQPFERLAVDIVGPFNTSRLGNKCVLTMQDDLTKFSYAVPLPNHTALTIAEAINIFISLFGIPKSILSDQGTEFTSSILKELTKLYKIRQIFATPYHPKSNSALERSHSTLKDYLKHFINSDHDNWDVFIPHSMFCYNTQVHKTTGRTPYELLFGHPAYIPSSLKTDPNFDLTYDDYYHQLKLRLNTIHKITRENILKSKAKSKTYYDVKIHTHDFKVGDQVLVAIKDTKPGFSQKLRPKFKGPFEIVKVNDRNTVDLKVFRRTVTYNTDLLKPYVSDPNKDEHPKNLDYSSDSADSSDEN